MVDDDGGFELNISSDGPDYLSQGPSRKQLRLEQRTAKFAGKRRPGKQPTRPSPSSSITRHAPQTTPRQPPTSNPPKSNPFLDVNGKKPEPHPAHPKKEVVKKPPPPPAPSTTLRPPTVTISAGHHAKPATTKPVAKTLITKPRQLQTSKSSLQQGLKPLPSNGVTRKRPRPRSDDDDDDDDDADNKDDDDDEDEDDHDDDGDDDEEEEERPTPLARAKPGHPSATSLPARKAKVAPPSSEASPPVSDKPSRKRPLKAVDQSRLAEYHAKPSDLVSPDAMANPLASKPSQHIFSKQKFEALGLHERMVSLLGAGRERHGFDLRTSTKVQSVAIPLLLQGRNALITSQTGSGKTLAYLIPLIQQLQAIQPPVKREEGTRMVVVAPTRELCQQIYQVLCTLVRAFIWIVPGIVSGGEKRKSEKARLRKGVVVLVATPGRLLDHLKNTKSLTCRHAQWLVLDEADRLLDLGFESQVKEVMEHMNSGRGKAVAAKPLQVVMVSATITPAMDRLSRQMMGDHTRIDADASTVEDVNGDGGETEEAASKKQKKALVSTASEAFTSTIPQQLVQHYMLVTCKLRLSALTCFLRRHAPGKKVLVFVSTCDSVDFHTQLFKSATWPEGHTSTRETFILGSNYPIFRLHGNIPQQERLRTVREFSEASKGLMFCTDVAARGLDLPAVDWIMQYDPPNETTEYVHRVGRTARKGQQGNALLFLIPSEREYLDVLRGHGITPAPLALQDTLVSCTPARFGRFKAPEEVFAIELQDSFEAVVESQPELLTAARKAFQSFVRAYAAYSKDVKHIFLVRSLHLGHVAKSFALRSAPTAVKVGGAAKLAIDKRGKAAGVAASGEDGTPSVPEASKARAVVESSGPRRKRMKRTAKTMRKLHNMEFDAA